MRKERDKEGVIEEIASRLRTAQINIQRVRHGGEGVERDSDGQDNIRLRRAVFQPSQSCQMGEVFDEEVAVREVTKDPKADNDGDQHPGAPLPILVCPRESTSRKPVDHCRQPEQNHKGWIPSSIEDVAGNEEVDFLRPPRERHRVQNENDYKENNED